MTQQLFDAPLARRIPRQSGSIVQAGAESFHLSQLFQQLLTDVFTADLVDVALVVGNGLVGTGTGKRQSAHVRHQTAESDDRCAGTPSGPTPSSTSRRKPGEDSN